MRARDGGRHIIGPAPLKTIAADDRLARRQRTRGSLEGHVILELSVGKPSALAVVENDVPLVPAALFVFVEDAPHHHERLAGVDAFARDLEGRAVRRQVGDLSYALEV